MKTTKSLTHASILNHRSHDDRSRNYGHAPQDLGQNPQPQKQLSANLPGNRSCSLGPRRVQTPRRLHYLQYNAYVGTQADEYTYADHVFGLNPETIEWAPEKLKAAIQDAHVLADKGEGDCTEFCSKAIKAGVVEYAVFIDGKKVVYFGPLGESHAESLFGHKPKVVASATSSCCVM